MLSRFSCSLFHQKSLFAHKIKVLSQTSPVMPVQVKIEENFKPYFLTNVIPCQHPPVEEIPDTKVEVKLEEEEDNSGQ